MQMSLPERLHERRTPGPPCSVGLLLANVTEQDRASIIEGMAMVVEARKTRPRESKLPPNASWLCRIIKQTLGIYISVVTMQRHINNECRCSRESA